MILRDANSGYKFVKFWFGKSIFYDETSLIVLSNVFFKLSSIDRLDCNGILSTNVMYKFSVRVVKNGILFTKKMLKYSNIFLCMFVIFMLFLLCLN